MHLSPVFVFTSSVMNLSLSFFALGLVEQNPLSLARTPELSVRAMLGGKLYVSANSLMVLVLMIWPVESSQL